MTDPPTDRNKYYSSVAIVNNGRIAKLMHCVTIIASLRLYSTTSGMHSYHLNVT
jgi:hypothetical protein